jgi:ParB-like chromosome segregation protein Spo0J
MPRKSPAAPVAAVQHLAVAALEVDDAIQPRERLDAATLHEYTETYREAEPDQEPFPPLDVFHLDEAYYVADGFHRLAAAREAGRETVPCHVHQGSTRDAMVFACFANVRRGLRYQHGDWGRILARLLADPEIAQRGDRPLATELGVSHVYVWKIRTRLAEEARLRDTLAQLPTTATTPQARIQEQLAQYLDVPVQTLQDLAAQSSPPSPFFPRRPGGVGNTASQLIDTLVRQTVEARQAPQQAARVIADELTRYRARRPVPDEPRPRLDRSKTAVAARQAERQREQLAQALRHCFLALAELYPWPMDDGGAEEEEALAADTPALRAKAQAMAEAVFAAELWGTHADFQAARLVFAALDQAWQARVAALAAAGIVTLDQGRLDVVWAHVPPSLRRA